MGSLIGALVLFSISEHIRKGYLLIFGLLLFYSSVAVLAVAPNVFITGVSMVILGMAFSAWMISVPVLLQVTASEEMRGRVMNGPAIKTRSSPARAI